jgi:D-glutamate N-acetyltransferase
MTAALEIASAAQQEGLRTAFVATGQTGIMLEGSGVAVDRVIGDFMAGAIEELVVKASQDADWVFVEGQGSLLHPGYSGVTLALLHGSAPDGMILVHPPNHASIDEYPVDIPPLTRLVQIYEDAASWIGRPARVVAIALNTRELDEQDAERAIREAEEETGLAATDPVRFGGKKLVEACVASLRDVPVLR